MVHCGEKWVNMVEKTPEICEMSERYRRNVDYWIGVCDQIITRGFDRNLVFKRFPEGAARELKKCGSDDAREKALNYICNQLKRGEKVTAPDLKAAIVMYEGGDNPTSCPAVKRGTIVPQSSPDNDVKKSEPSDDAPPQSLGQQIQADEMRQADQNQIPAEKHVAAAKVTINPVIVPDTYREVAGTIRYHCVCPDGCDMRYKEPALSPEVCGSCNSLRPLTDGRGKIMRQSPFKTGSQIKAGIAGEMFPDHIVDANEMVSPPALTPEEKKKADKQHRIDIADQLIETMPGSFPGMVRDILREHPSWHTDDVFYFGVLKLHDAKGRM